ncbi:MAG: transcription antitermination factor NusB [Legionellales bacterium]|nr:transcription antitermination factor NusB [Legionellales bacterium]NDH66639.1 transcription antitermination factor NusB [Gammaproteobacteria bacterium]
MSNESISGKRRARKLALQSLYQWLMAGTVLTDIEAQFSAANNMDKVDVEYYRRLINGIPKELSVIEEALKPFLDRPIESLNPIELTILRLCTFELFHCPEIPYRVILDESVSLAKAFGSQDGHKYVNGVLHNLAQIARKTEIEGR